MLVQLGSSFSSRRDEIAKAVKKRDDQIRKAEESVQISEKAGIGTDAFRKTVRGIAASSDAANGGFGKEPKFPMVPSLAILVQALFETGGPDFRDPVVRTLGAIADRGLHDPIDGGFFRYTTSENWTGPQFEKLTEDNASLARAFLDGWLLTGTTAYRDRAESTLRYLRDNLLDADTGLFAVAQNADEDYYALPEKKRKKRERPEVNRRYFPGSNATAVSAFLRAGFVLEDPELSVIALRCLGAIEVKRDLLHDRVTLASTLLDAYEASGRKNYLEDAERWMKDALHRFRGEDGGLRDRIHSDGDIGDLRRENVHIDENAVAADTLLRLATLVEEPAYRKEAEKILTSFPDFQDSYGHYTARYAVAMDRAARPCVMIDVVAPPSDPLVRAALAPYVSRRIVRWFPSEFPPVVRIYREGGSPEAASTPDEVAQRLADLPT